MQEREHQLQVQCVNWFRQEFPTKIIFAIPNGGWRKLLTAIKLKAEGATSGVPDLFCPEPSQDKHGLWIEMKVKGGRLQDSQKAMISALQLRGYEVEVCFTFDQFRSAVLRYFGINEDVSLSPKDKLMKEIERAKERLQNQRKCKGTKKKALDFVQI